MDNYSINVVWSEEDQSYVATSPEFQHLSAVGDTRKEAFDEFQEVLEAAIEIYDAEGWELPKPKSLHGYSGQFRVRLPKGLHGRLAQQAEIEGVSLNTLVVSYLSAGLAERNAPSQTEQNLNVVVGTDNARIVGKSPVSGIQDSPRPIFQTAGGTSSFRVDNLRPLVVMEQDHG